MFPGGEDKIRRVDSLIDLVLKLMWCARIGVGMGVDMFLRLRRRLRDGERKTKIG